VDKINLQTKLNEFSTHWDPKIIAELNGQNVKLAKFMGEFVWHHHEDEDELFLVLSGSFDMLFRDHTVHLEEGDMIVVPSGTEHCPSAENEVHVLLFEPAETLNTGNIRSERTVEQPSRL
jgi:mannose-6-phosphate isomerase-like protein (cupin superfamily)